MFIEQGAIYKAKRDAIYDTTKPDFDCFSPLWEGEVEVVDCLVVTQYGDVHPATRNGVRVHTMRFGKMIGYMEE